MAVYASGGIVQAAASFARPANTTAYAVGDVVSNNASTTTPLTFANVASRAGGGGIIRKARVMTDQGANVAVYKLWLFKVVAFTVAADNAALTAEWDDRASLIGVITFSAAATNGSGDVAFDQALPNIPFVCADGSFHLYGVLETETIFTPASGQNYIVELTIEQE